MTGTTSPPSLTDIVLSCRYEDSDCPVCGEWTHHLHKFGLALLDRPRLCTDCADRYGHDCMTELADGLNSIDMAVYLAPPEARAGLLGAALDALSKIIKDTDKETA